jgi:predicted nucleotidyltransferase
MAATIQVEIPIEQIAEFCQRWRIVEFALFGSVLTERFQAESDVDVLVEFAPKALYTLGELDEMEEELEAIFGRSVDLIDKQAVRESQNHLRRQEILGTAQVIHQIDYA